MECESVRYTGHLDWSFTPGRSRWDVHAGMFTQTRSRRDVHAHKFTHRYSFIKPQQLLYRRPTSYLSTSFFCSFDIFLIHSPIQTQNFIHHRYLHFPAIHQRSIEHFSIRRPDGSYTPSHSLNTLFVDRKIVYHCCIRFHTLCFVLVIR